MLIINNRFLSLYDYNFLLVKEKIFSVNQRKVKEKKITNNGEDTRLVKDHQPLFQDSFFCLIAVILGRDEPKRRK